MREFLSRHKWPVIAAVLMVIVALQMLVGRAADFVAPEAPAAVTDHAPEVYTAHVPPTIDEATQTAAPDEETFADDDDLIDNAQGDDPTPDEPVGDNGDNNGPGDGVSAGPSGPVVIGPNPGSGNDGGNGYSPDE